MIHPQTPSSLIADGDAVIVSPKGKQGPSDIGHRSEGGSGAQSLGRQKT
jgi:hypothetical protein